MGHNFSIVVCDQVRPAQGGQWLSGRGLTRNRGAAGLSLTGVTALWSLSKTHLS